MILKKRCGKNLFLGTLIMTLWGAWISVVCFIVPAGNVYAAQRDFPAFALPAYEKIKLRNGLTVYFMEHHGTPLIFATAVFPAGALKDGSKYGLAYLTAENLFSGTKNYRKKQIEEKLEFLGAIIMPMLVLKQPVFPCPL